MPQIIHQHSTVTRAGECKVSFGYLQYYYIDTYLLHIHFLTLLPSYSLSLVIIIHLLFFSFFACAEACAYMLCMSCCSHIRAQQTNSTSTLFASFSCRIHSLSLSCIAHSLIYSPFRSYQNKVESIFQQFRFFLCFFTHFLFSALLIYFGFDSFFLCSLVSCVCELVCACTFVCMPKYVRSVNKMLMSLNCNLFSMNSSQTHTHTHVPCMPSRPKTKQIHCTNN